jgi:2-haloacid dehalogenase
MTHALPIPVFDLGAVLVDWQPRAMYAKRFPGQEADVEWVLANAWTHEWNLETDRGMGHQEAAGILKARHPHQAELIQAYADHWIDMLVGDIPGTVEIFNALRRQVLRIYAITNWNQDTFKLARGRYPFLEEFDGIVVSGDEKLIKPDRAIFDLFFSRHEVAAADCIFIDDNAANIETARALGMIGHHFKTPDALRRELLDLGFAL